MEKEEEIKWEITKENLEIYYISILYEIMKEIYANNIFQALIFRESPPSIFKIITHNEEKFVEEFEKFLINEIEK